MRSPFDEGMLQSWTGGSVVHLGIAAPAGGGGGLRVHPAFAMLMPLSARMR